MCQKNIPSIYDINDVATSVRIFGQKIVKLMSFSFWLNVQNLLGHPVFTYHLQLDRLCLLG